MTDRDNVVNLNTKNNLHLKCFGVGRDTENPQSLLFTFNRKPTNDELRFLHDVMRRAAVNAPKEG